MQTADLLNYDWRQKWAADQDVEKSFLDLAYQELQDKAAPLMKPQYRLGFEIVEKNDSNSRMVGIFAFHIGDNLYYAPVFFLNGQLKGTDLLYSHSTKSFIPLMEPWLDYLVRSQQQPQGQAINPGDVKGWRQGPNFWQMLYPPGRHKIASVETVEKVVDGLNEQKTCPAVWLEMQLMADVFVKEAKNIPADLLPKYLKASDVKALETVVGWAKESPKFAQALAEVYPNDEWLVAAPAKVAAEKKTVTVKTQVHDYATPLDKKKMLTRKYVVEDNRDEIEFSRIYGVSYGEQLSNPSESGLYRVLTRGGNTIPMLILKDPMGLDGIKREKALCLPMDKKENTHVAFMADLKALYVDPRVEHEATSMDFPANPMLPEADLNKISIPVNKMEIGKTYAIISPDHQLQSVHPVQIDGIMTSDGENKAFQAHEAHTICIHEEPVYRAVTSDLGGSLANYAETQVPAETIEITDAQLSKVRKSGTRLFIPSNLRAIEVEVDTWRNPEIKLLFPGTFDDIQTKLAGAGIHKLAAEQTLGGDILIRVDSVLDSCALMPDAAMLRLMGGCGFKEVDAEQFVELVQKQGSAKVMFKSALESNVIQTGEMPEFYTYFDPELMAHQETPQRYELPIYNVTPPPPIPKIGDKYTEEGYVSSLNPTTLSELAMAEQGKAIFDHGIVGHLSKTYSAQGMIDEYLDKLMAALDALGRIIFLYYWKNTEFVNMYGSDDMPEMENKLLGNFKNLGDIVIELKIKSLTKDKDQGKNAPA